MIGAFAFVLVGIFFTVEPAQADSTICTSDSYSMCVDAGYTDHGYSAHSTSSYWTMYPGHNCTNYAAYVEQQLGAPPSLTTNLGDADTWDNNAPANGATVNQSPTVGSVAQWEDGPLAPIGGHVAIVEAVTSTSITISEDNYDVGPFTWRVISTGSSGWPNHFIHFPGVTTDTDGDGTPDSSDVMPAIPGPSNNRGAPIVTSNLAGDFNGDGKKDIAVFYNYGNDQTKIFVFYGTGGGGFASPVAVWDSGIGNWDWTAMKPVVGDFNGDGISDIAVFYDYGGTQTKIWTFFGSTSGAFANPTLEWDSGVGNWEWTRTMPLVGDFNGDGKTDVAVLYNYGGATSTLFMFTGNGTGTLLAPQVAWSSGAGNWDWTLTKPDVGDFTGDGIVDIAVVYDSNDANGESKVFEFVGTNSGTFANPGVEWDSGLHNWDWSRSLVP